MTNEEIISTSEVPQSALNKLKWYNSIAVQLFLILALLFIILAGLAYYALNSQGRSDMNAASNTMIERTGNEAVKGIVANILRVDGMALTAEKMTSSLPKEDSLYIDTFEATMNAADDNVVSGGIWFEPNAFAEGLERKTFFWIRDENGHMQVDTQYDDPAKVPDPYYKDWWYTPAKYSQHDNCVWSRAYIDPVSQYPMLTCAKPLRNKKNQFEGTITIDLQLSNLNKLMEGWQKITGGYIFLADLDNHFLTFPDDQLVKRPSALNPKGDFMFVQDFAKEQSEFKPIADALQRTNDTILQKAASISRNNLDNIANNILLDTQKQKIASNESKVLAAIMINTKNSQYALQKNHLIEKVDIPYDFKLKQSATAYVFLMPYTNWKVVIVKPMSETNALADSLISKLLGYLALGFIPIALLSLFLIHRLFIKPLRTASNSVQTLTHLVEEKRYLDLQDNKLDEKGKSEISLVSSSMNQLVDRVVENEGALAKINVILESRVKQRTKALTKAMKDLKQSQMHLVQSEKMSLLGQMVAGVTHEVNTPLGYVKSNILLFDELLEYHKDLLNLSSQLSKQITENGQNSPEVAKTINAMSELLDEMKEDEVEESLDKISSDTLFGISQISELVVNLKDFARIDESKVKAVDIRDCIKSSLKIAQNNIKGMTIIKKYDDTLPKISCSPSQINQILLNLFNNAAHATEDKDKPTLKIATERKDNFVVIKVQDNGSGMPKETQKKIFDPFFTTKPSGKGTGLGLAICRQIIEQHQGHLRVASKEGEGTLFAIYLPITDKT